MSELELVFVEVPLASAASFLLAIRQYYGDALVNDRNQILGAAAELAEPPKVPAHARAVHGHFRADRYFDFPEAYHVTFLRDPVDQLISLYYYWLTCPAHGDHRHDRFLAERPDIVSFARGRTGSMLHGFFGGVDLRRLDYVGFYDRRQRDYRVLSLLLGFDIYEALTEEDAPALPAEWAAQRKCVEADSAIRSALGEALEEDYLYYDFMRSEWS